MYLCEVLSARHSPIRKEGRGEFPPPPPGPKSRYKSKCKCGKRVKQLAAPVTLSGKQK